MASGSSAVELLSLGAQQLRQRLLVDAEATFVEAAAAAKEKGDILSEARAFGYVAIISSRRGDHELALSFHSKALRGFERSREQGKQAVILYQMAVAHDSLGRRSRAREVMRACAALAATADPARAKAATNWIRTHPALGSDAQGDQGPLEADEDDGSDLGNIALGGEGADPLEADGRPRSATAASGDAMAAIVEAEPVQAPMMEFRFENLAFREVRSQSERSLKVLSSAVELLKRKASAEERYARSLGEVRAFAAAMREDASGNSKDGGGGSGSGLLALLGGGKRAPAPTRVSRQQRRETASSLASMLSQAATDGAGAAAHMLSSALSSFDSMSRQMFASEPRNQKPAAAATAAAGEAAAGGAGGVPSPATTPPSGRDDGLGPVAVVRHNGPTDKFEPAVESPLDPAPGTLGEALTGIAGSAEDQVRHRMMLSAFLGRLGADLARVRDLHHNVQQLVLRDAEAVLKQVRDSQNQVRRAHVRLSKARQNQQRYREQLSAKQEALVKAMGHNKLVRADREARGEPAESPEPDQAAGGNAIGGILTSLFSTKDGRGPFSGRRGSSPKDADGRPTTVDLVPMQAELAGLNQSYVKSVRDTELAEAATQEAVTSSVLARKARASQLRGIAAKLQALEDHRATTMAKVMKSVTEAEATALALAHAAQARAAEVASHVDADSDLRMFVHKARVQGMISEQKRRDREATRGEAARRRRAEQARAAKAKADARAAKAKAEEEAAAAAAAAEAEQALEGDWAGAEPQADGGGAQPNPEAAAAATAPAPAAAPAPSRPPPPVSEPQEDDDEGDGVVPVTTTASHRKVFAAESLRAERRLRPVVRAWVKTLFDTDEEPDEDAAVDAAVMFAHPMGRVLFLKHLNVRRAQRRELSRARFERLADAMRLFLDACMSHGDVAAAKMMMMMSETFYTLDPTPLSATRPQPEAAAAATVPELSPAVAASPMVTGDDASPSARAPQKVFVQTLVSSHPIWLSPEFWEEAFYRSVREEVQKMHNPHARLGSTLLGRVTEMADDEEDEEAGEDDGGAGGNDEAAPAAADGDKGGKGSRDRAEAKRGSRAAALAAASATVASVTVRRPLYEPGGADWHYAYQQVLFGQLGSFAMSMRSFGMQQQDAERIVVRLARGNGLPAEMTEHVLEAAERSAAANRHNDGFSIHGHRWERPSSPTARGSTQASASQPRGTAAAAASGAGASEAASDGDEAASAGDGQADEGEAEEGVAPEHDADEADADEADEGDDEDIPLDD